MTTTDNYNLKLIEEHDLLDFAPFNENANIIDTQLKANADAVAGIPTLETAVSANTSAISGLTTRVGTLETASSSQASDISGLTTRADNTDTALTNIGNSIHTISGEIADLHDVDGDVLQFKNNQYTLNPNNFVKKLTYIGDVQANSSGQLAVLIPSSYLPTSFANYYINGSIVSKTNTVDRTAFYLCDSYINDNGSLVIVFDTIKNGIDPNGNYPDLANPTYTNPAAYVEIMFMS